MKKFLKIIFLILLVGVIISVIVFSKGYAIYKKVLEETPLEEKVKEIEGKEGYTKLKDLPQTYIDAVVATEDRRFYHHGAIDFRSIGRAIFTNIKSMDLVEGGSTITQQLAKNAYFTQEKTLNRKTAEIFMAFYLEKHLEKNQILELYINTMYFGSGYYNIKDACQGYFGKDPKDMTKAESIMLAGIPNAPSVYNPNSNSDLAKERQKQVVNKMVKYGYLTKAEGQKILEEIS